MVKNPPNGNGDTILHICVENDMSEYVDLLLQHGADPFIKNSQGDLSFDIAVKKFAIHSLSIFLERKIYGNMDYLKEFRDTDGTSLLHKAISVNSVECVKHLVNFIDVNTLNNEMDSYSDGGTPLHQACQIGCVEMVNALLELGADINNQENFYGNSPLHIACSFRNDEVVDILLKKGANIQLLNKEEESILQMAENGGSENCLKLLQNHLPQ